MLHSNCTCHVAVLQLSFTVTSNVLSESAWELGLAQLQQLQSSTTQSTQFEYWVDMSTTSSSVAGPSCTTIVELIHCVNLPKLRCHLQRAIEPAAASQIERVHVCTAAGMQLGGLCHLHTLRVDNGAQQQYGDVLKWIPQQMQHVPDLQTAHQQRHRGGGKSIELHHACDRATY